MRTPSLAVAGSTGLPLRVIECTAAVIASMKVDAPGRAAKVTVVVDANVFSPVVRSRTTS